MSDEQEASAASEPSQTPEPQGPGSSGGATTKQVIDRLKELGPVVGALGVLSVTAPGILGAIVLFGSALGQERIAPFVESLGPSAPVIVALLMAVTTGSAILPTYALSFACGVLLSGLPVGGAVAMFGVVGGSLVGYGWGTLLVRKRVMGVIERHERASVIRRALLDRSLADETLVVGLIRFPPNSPFALTNFVMSSTGVRLIPYLIGTAVGIAPRTLFAVWVGTQVESITEATGWGGRGLKMGLIVIAVVTFVAVYKLLSRWARQALEERGLAAGP